MTLGERLKQELKQRRWTPYKLSQEIGVAPYVVSRWIRGDNDPTLFNAIMICNALGLSLDYLASGLDTDGIKADVCENLCKYPYEWNEDLYGELCESDICKNCPLERWHQ